MELAHIRLHMAKDYMAKDYMARIAYSRERAGEWRFT